MRIRHWTLEKARIKEHIEKHKNDTDWLREKLCEKWTQRDQLEDENTMHRMEIKRLMTLLSPFLPPVEEICISGIDRRIWLVKNIDKGERVLDVGGGVGEMFSGTDIDFTIIDNRSGLSEDAKLPDNFIEGDAHNLPFEDDSFDVVVLADILEHVSDPIQVLREAHRVTKSKVLITVPNEVEWGIAQRPFSMGPHIRHYDQLLLVEHLSKAMLSFHIMKLHYPFDNTNLLLKKIFNFSFFVVFAWKVSTWKYNTNPPKNLFLEWIKSLEKNKGDDV